MVTALGELLIDFAPAGRSAEGVPRFEMHPGGAPGNVLTMLAKLGDQTEFIGMVGQDQFGDYLIDTLQRCGVGTAHITKSGAYNTTMAFVHLNEEGDRSFTFCRKNGADIYLDLTEKALETIKNSDIFHFGSLSLTDDPCRTATIQAVASAKNVGVFISYDPNLRLPLWSSMEMARREISSVIRFVDLIKVSEEELKLITDTADYLEGSLILQQYWGVKIVLVTLGAKGSFYRVGGRSGHIPAFPVDPVDTTAAGDAFTGALLHKLLEKGVREYARITDWDNILRYANAAGALTTLHKGAIISLPDKQDIEKLINT